MLARFLFMLTFVFSPALSAAEAPSETEGTYLYRVTTIRAAQGGLEQLLIDLSALKDSGFYTASGSEPPMVMRHSQGDQWDLMLVYPMGSLEQYFSADRIAKRQNAEGANTERAIMESLAFRESVFATGPSLQAFRASYDANALYHIEMFHAAAGKKQALLRQRQIENDYLMAVEGFANMIFVGQDGNDVDIFTIGFYENLQDYAEPSPATPEEAEAAAKAAGFKDRADISFLLRKLINRHHDTLAVKVQ